jgi:hypothetical protein
MVKTSGKNTIPHGPGLARLVTDHYGADRSIKKGGHKPSLSFMPHDFYTLAMHTRASPCPVLAI